MSNQHTENSADSGQSDSNAGLGQKVKKMKTIVKLLAKTKLGDWIANFGLAIRKVQMNEIFEEIFGPIDDDQSSSKPG